MIKATHKLRSLPTRFAPIRERFTVVQKRVVHFVDKRPLLFFLFLLGLLVLLIIFSNLIQNKQPVQKETAAVVKPVSVYQIGTAPKITVQAVTKKSGVIQITALSNGVIDKIHHVEGDTIKRGEPLVSMSSNYQGSNTFSIQRQIAQQQYNGLLKTYPDQKSAIKKQREIAEKTEENAEDLRSISEQSLSETQNLISLNEDILRTLDEDLRTLEQNPVANRAMILATKQLKSQFTSATNQARSNQRTTQYQASDDKPPAEIAELQKELTIKQLDIQLKQLDLNKEVTRLQAALAQVNEAIMFPVAPFSGTVQRVLVKEKQSVTSGTLLMVFAQAAEEDPITAVAFVSRDIAQRISRFEPSILHLGDAYTYTSLPSFVSSEAVEGTLYAAYYPIPDDMTGKVVSEGFITVEIPIGYPDTGAVIPFVPLDAVYVTRDSAYVFVVQDGRAKSKEVMLGQVYGRFVEITGGLGAGTQIILDRTVIEGDKVEVD